MHWDYRQVTQGMTLIKRDNFKENRKQEFEWQGYFFSKFNKCDASLFTIIDVSEEKV